MLVPLMTAVPRLYELLQSDYKPNREGKSTETSSLRDYHSFGSEAGIIRFRKILNTLCDRLVRQKVRQRFGGQLRYFVSGGASKLKYLNFSRGLALVYKVWAD